MGSGSFPHAPVRCSLTVVAAQIAIAVVALGTLALAPPSHGNMMLIPLRPGLPAARIALAADARLLAAGPGGGVIVRGDRDALFWPLLRAGVLTMAAPAALCGGRA
jgi:hypothetical protein